MQLKKDSPALTPPMGWNSWDCYAAAVNEEQLLGNADYMCKHLKPHGWEYVVCDIQWSDPLAGTTQNEYINFTTLTLDGYSRLIPAPNRFPSSKDSAGFRPIADQIHGMGLKFGIHIMRGIPRQAVHAHGKIMGTEVTADRIALPASICRWNSDMYGVDCEKPGAQEYYNSLFSLYAEWHVDYVKVDDICNTNIFPHDPYSAQKEIEMIRRAIDQSGRQMVLSLSPGPAVIEKAWHMEQNANMWRITDDFWDDWALLYNMFERCEVWQKHVSPGCWPDCDMLPLGHIGIGFHQERRTRFTRDEQITMMTLWCIFRSPLMMGGELRDNDDWTLSLLTNDEVLYLLKGSHDASQVERNADGAVWVSADDTGDGLFVALFNFTEQPREMTFDSDAIGQAGCFSVRDLWQHTELGGADRYVKASVNPHGARLFKLTNIQ